MALTAVNGGNDWLLSTYVNLLAAGVSTSAAKAAILTMVPNTTDMQTDVGALIDAEQSNCVTLAGLAFTGRAPASGWNYLTSSPMQTYAHTG